MEALSRSSSSGDSSVSKEGHPEGLLDRDQRTVSRGRFDDMTAARVLARCTSSSWNNNIMQPPHHHPHQRQTTRKTTVSWAALRRTLHRLGEALVIGVVVLSAVRLPPTAMSAPLGQLEAHLSTRPKWINPCGLGGPDELDSEVATDYHANTDEMLDRIVVQAKNALMHAQMFKDDFAQKTFNVGSTELHELWRNRRYDWLPDKKDIPKTLGEPAPQDHLDKLKLENALKDIYQYLQKFAVGLEQVVWDQDDEGGDFKNAFQDAEYKLKATLCEVQVAMLESSVMQHADITRDLMSPDYRLIQDASFRNLRDWVILRDYMNGLEYLIQVFNYFKNK